MSSDGGEAKLALRVKSKKSQNAVLRDLSPKTRVKELLEKLSVLTGVPPSQMALLKGFPPKRIAYSANLLVESLGLQNQDTLIVETDDSGNPGRGEEASSPPAPSPPPEQLPPVSTSSDAAAPELIDLVDNEEEFPGLLLRQVVPSDNSCLFSSVTFCLSGSLDTSSSSSFLRDIIANAVEADPTRFSEAVLGRSNSDYVTWIRKAESWGGGIELSVLAEFYGLEISVVDTQSLSVSCFGEDKNYPQRIFLIYDGIHYDPLYFEPFNGTRIRTMFPVRDERMTELALELAREAKASNQFTDLKNFALRCQQCNTLLKGEAEAQEHAKKTAHTNFAEIQQNK